MKKLLLLMLIAGATGSAKSAQTIDLTNLKAGQKFKGESALTLLKALPPAPSFYMDDYIQMKSIQNFKALVLKVEEEKFVAIECHKGAIINNGHMSRVPQYQYLDGVAECEVNIIQDAHSTLNIDFKEMAENAVKANNGIFGIPHNPHNSEPWSPGSSCTGRVCD